MQKVGLHYIYIRNNNIGVFTPCARPGHPKCSLFAVVPASPSKFLKPSPPDHQPINRLALPCRSRAPLVKILSTSQILALQKHPQPALGQGSPVCHQQVGNRSLTRTSGNADLQVEVLLVQVEQGYLLESGSLHFG